MRAAIITLTCGHTNTYGSPYPKYGDRAWCYRCDKNKAVAKVSREIDIDQSHLTTGYNKSSEITQTTCDQPRYY